MDYKIDFLLFATIIFGILTGCKKDSQPEPSSNSAAHGFFIVNEGNFTYGNASLSFLDDSSMSIDNDVFFRTNNAPLGDVACHMTIYSQSGFITLNNSGKIYKINPVDYTFSGKITDLTSPRQTLILNSTKAYISDIYNTNISTFNPTTMSLTGTINTHHTTECMLAYDNRIFISCWSYDNKILVLDPQTDQITDSLEVGKQPNSMAFDKNGKLWVLSDGGYPGSPYGQEAASLSIIDPSSLTLIRQFTFTDINLSPKSLQTNPAGDSLFFLAGNVYCMSINDSELPSTPLIDAGSKTFYTLAIHPEKDWLIISDAKNYTVNSDILIYFRNGSLIKTVNAGINAGWICFRD